MPAAAAAVAAVVAPTEVAVGVLSSLAYPLAGRPFGSPGVLAAALASAETPLPVAFLFACLVLDLTAVLAGAAAAAAAAAASAAAALVEKAVEVGDVELLFSAFL